MAKADEIIADIKLNPKRHQHKFGELAACCYIDGVFDTRVLNAHDQYAPIGRNGGQACDVTAGPCACGAWH